jgi:Family of unknown function (DUF6399)
MTLPQSTPAADTRTGPSRRPRAQAAQARDHFRDPGHTTSQRQYAREHGLPRSTLGHWLRQDPPDGLDPDLAAFLGSVAGERFLRRLVLALLLVFHHENACGLRPVGHFLRLTQLDRVVASSYGALYGLAAHLQADLPTFGDQERDRLAPGMAPRDIAVCGDEHFHATQPCLVAIEPVSDFILVEVYRPQRDADTWTQVLHAGLRGLPVRVVLLCSDRAKGLLACARDGLQVAHSPDLLHAQRDLLRPLLLPLARQTAQADKDRQQAQALAQYWRDQQAQDAARPSRPGRRLDYAGRIRGNECREQRARQQVERGQARQQQVVEAVRGLADDAHPFDPQSGQRLQAEAVRERLEGRLLQVQQVAEQAQLGEAAAAGLNKGRAWVTALVGVVAWFWGLVERRVQALNLPEEAEQAVYGQLLPGLYWQQQARRGRDAEQRRQRRALAEGLLRAAWAEGGALAALPQEQRHELTQQARQVVGLFARSSSCVEGRNGRLSLQHHGHGPLSAARLQAQTVIHNYFTERPDGTTAAQRFFGQKPRDLFRWLLERLPDLPQPAARRPRPGLQTVAEGA